MNHRFLLVGNGLEKESGWARVLARALSSLGELNIVSEEEAVRLLVEDCLDAIIVDAGAVGNVAKLVTRLRSRLPDVRVIVATASTTWQRAREVLKAGAAEYIRKSGNEAELGSILKVVREGPVPS